MVLVKEESVKTETKEKRLVLTWTSDGVKIEGTCSKRDIIAGILLLMGQVDTECASAYIDTANAGATAIKAMKEAFDKVKTEDEEKEDK